MSAVAWIAFVVAAAIGAPARYVLSEYVGARVGARFPWGTLVVNVTGSFVLGFITGLALYHSFPDEPRIVLGTGFCGAYTTFATFGFETMHLAEEGDVGLAVRNTVGTFVLGAIAAAAGIALAAL